jgi:hypothetical protein
MALSPGDDVAPHLLYINILKYINMKNVKQVSILLRYGAIGRDTGWSGKTRMTS